MRNVSAAVLVAVIALTCSACSFFGGPFGSVSAPPVVRTVPVVPPSAVQGLPFSTGGAGAKSLGTVLLNPRAHIKATCVGSGFFELDINGPSAGVAMMGQCLNSTGKPALDEKIQSRITGPSEIKVRAPAGAKWHLTITG